MLSRTFVLLSLLILALNTGAGPVGPSRDMMIVHNSHEAVPVGFESKGPAPAEIEIDIYIALSSNNMSGLENALYDVSTPTSPNYRKFLSKEQVESFVKPSDEAKSAVDAWIKVNDLEATTLSPAGDWIKITVPISKANSLFDADYHTYTHTQSGAQDFRTLTYSLPASLKGAIQAIHPATSFDFGTQKGLSFQMSGTGLQKKIKENKGAQAKRDLPSVCSSGMTPTCLQQLYGIPSSPATQVKNTIAVMGSANRYAQVADLEQFLLENRPDLPSNTSFGVVSVDGGVNTQGPNLGFYLANLDIQYTVGLASGVPTILYPVGGNTTDGLFGFIDIVTAMSKQPVVPNVWTGSYGFNEPLLDLNIVTKVCNAYMSFSARGTSIIMSSGDGGVAGFAAANCADGPFQTSFPSTCPFVTSVGGTSGFSPEISASFSSGGFSRFFSRPSYQSNDVSTYLSRLGPTNSGRYNSSGRGFPDISAQATGISIVNNGQIQTISGTGASASIVASIIALINDRLIAAGKPPVGFLNPVIYGSGISAFTDISLGDNPGCNTAGFPSLFGWDPVTGLGTPVFSKLAALFGV